MLYRLPYRTLPCDASHACRLKPADIAALYAALKDKLALNSIHLVHGLLSSALQAAVENGLVNRNVARQLKKGSKPRRPKPHENIAKHTWTAAEATAFLTVVGRESPQVAALYRVALVTGARVGELAGLRWSDLDLETNRLRRLRQLDDRGTAPDFIPAFGPPKNKRPRTVDLDAQTIARLRVHQRTQAELKMKNRTTVPGP